MRWRAVCYRIDIGVGSGGVELLVEEARGIIVGCAERERWVERVIIAIVGVA